MWSLFHCCLVKKEDKRENKGGMFFSHKLLPKKLNCIFFLKFAMQNTGGVRHDVIKILNFMQFNVNLTVV